MSKKILVATIAIFCTLLPTDSAAQYFYIPVHRTNLLFAGDIMQHQNQLDAARTTEGTYSYSGYYRHIQGVVKSADIAVANLETPIGRSNFSGYPSFCAPDSFLYAARDAGFNVLLFANNHCLDRGARGVRRTLAMLDSLGIEHTGVYLDSIDRAQRHPYILKKNNMRIALLNYTYGTNGRNVPAPMVVNLIDREVIAEDIQKAKSMNVDAIIACMHWGDEYVSLPPERVRDLADWLVEQGVSHIIGNHPHVIQPIEIKEDPTTPDRHAVVYSTGNLVSNMSLTNTDGGIVVRMELKKTFNYTRLSSLDYLFTWIAPRQNNGKRDFTILPAATTVITGSSRAAQMRTVSSRLYRTLARRGWLASSLARTQGAFSSIYLLAREMTLNTSARAFWKA